MKIKTKGLNPELVHKRELINELYQIIKNESNEKRAFYDISINKENPKKSTLIANRPGVQLLASELLLSCEDIFDDWVDDAPITFNYLDAGKKSEKTSTVRLAKLEIVEYDSYANSINHNEAAGFNNAFTNTLWVVGTCAILLLALFGLIAVIKFFV